MKRPVVIASAFALACGLTASAADETWFDAKINTYTSSTAWNVTAGIVGGAWASGALDAATLDTTGGESAAKLQVDADVDQPLEFDATAGRAPADGAVTVNSTLSFNAFESTSLPEAPTDAKAGIIAVKSGDDYSYYGLVMEGEGESYSNVWKQLSGVTPTALTLADVPVSVTVATNGIGGHTVSYKIDGTALTYDGATEIPVLAGTVSKAAYCGCGTVASLSSTYFVPTGTFALGDFSASEMFEVDYVTNMTTNVRIDISQGASVTLPKDTVVRVYFKVKSGVAKDFSGDNFVTRTIAENQTSTVQAGDEPAVTDATARIGSTYYLTLVKAISNATENALIELLADQTGVGSDIATNCTIDLGGHTYTYAYETPSYANSQFDINKDVASVIIQNGTFLNGTNAEGVVRSTRCMLRSYCKSLIVSNVLFDATGVNSAAVAFPGQRDNYLGVIAATSGDLILNGSTKIINASTDANWSNAVNAVSFGNYAGASYTMGTLTIDTTEPLAGNVLLTGGAISNYSGKVQGRYLVGANYLTYFDAAPDGFNAMIGRFATESDKVAKAYLINKTGELFVDFAAANAAATSADTVTLRAALSLSAATTFNGGTLVPGSYTITLTDAEASLTYKDNSLLSSFATSVEGKVVQYNGTAYVVAASGPTPAPGGKVEPVPGAETPTYTVTATNAEGTVELSGVKSGDTLEMTGTNVTSISVTDTTFSGVTIKIKGRNGTVIDNGAFYGLSSDSKTFTATLKADAKVTLKIGDEEKQIPVTPTIGDGLVSDPFTVGDNVSTKIAAIPGLTYSLVRYDKLGSGKSETTVASETATETTLELTDDSAGELSAAFYVIEVSK